jgi:hypothetical protein
MKRVSSVLVMVGSAGPALRSFLTNRRRARQLSSGHDATSIA